MDYKDIRRRRRRKAAVEGRGGVVKNGTSSRVLCVLCYGLWCVNPIRVNDSSEARTEENMYQITLYAEPRARGRKCLLLRRRECE